MSQTNYFLPYLHQDCADRYLMNNSATSINRLSFGTVSGLTTVSAVAYLIARVIKPTIDPDLFWHLRTGDVIVHDGIPREDIFSFTVLGDEWITHEWLSQVLAWFAYNLGGLVGVAVFFGVVGLICLFFVYRTVAGGPLLKALLTVFVFRVAIVSFGARVQLFTLTFAAVFVWLVERVRRGEASSKSLWLAVPMTLVWANLHSGFLLGVIILGTYTVGEYAQRRWFEPTESTLSVATVGVLAKVTAACFAIAVINPSTWKLWWYPIATLRSEAMQALIAEWQSPDFHRSLFYPFAALLLGGAIVMGASTRKLTVTDALLFGGTCAAGLSSLRHVSLAAVVAVPVVAPHLVSALERTRFGDYANGTSDRKLSVSPLFVAAISGILLVVGLVGALSTLRDNESIVEQLYPLQAIDYIDNNGLSEVHGYNSYRYGGYLIWTDHEVFVDGRADVYWDFLWDYRNVSHALPGWEEVVERFDLQWAMTLPTDPIHKVLAASPDWSVGYADDIVTVYLHTPAVS